MISFDKAVRIDNSLQNNILSLLPQTERGVIVKVRQESSSFFSFTIRLDITEKENALNWIKDFEETTLTTYKVLNTFAEHTQKIVFKKNFHCEHNTRPKSFVLKPHEKHTKCRATLNIVIKPPMKRSRDPYLDEFPCEVTVNWFHNHTISYEGLKYRRSDELWTTFASYFASGHSPLSALELHKMKLQTEYGEQYYKVAADGARCPNNIWCYKLYYKIFNRKSKDMSGEDVMACLEKNIEEYNHRYQEICAMMSKDMTTQDVVVSVVSPLSKRVLTLKSVQELMFVTRSGHPDTGSKRSKSCKVIILLSPSVAGALPLGVIVATTDREVVVTKGIEMVKDILVGEFSPKIIITDDSESERNSLSKMFPVSSVLLCKSHVLHSVWRYLSNSKHNATRDKRAIFKQFSAALHSKTKEAFDANFTSLLSMESVRNNEVVSAYFMAYLRREVEWAMYARAGMLARNKYTFSNSEASIRVLKEQILHRTKSFNIVQLVDAMTSVLCGYYEKRLLNYVNNRAQAWESKYYMPVEKIAGLEVSETNDGEYTVTHPKGEEFVVNHDIGACTCPHSVDGTLCKHQYAVMCKYGLHSEQLVQTKDVVAKKHLYYIATGEQLMEDGARWNDGRLLSPKVEMEVKEENELDREESERENSDQETEERGESDRETEDDCGEEEEEAEEQSEIVKLERVSRTRRTKTVTVKLVKNDYKKRRTRKRKLSSDVESDQEDTEAPESNKAVADVVDSYKTHIAEIADKPRTEIDENEDDGVDKELLEEYSDMAEDSSDQHPARDADIEKELILEDLKDMIKVVPAEDGTEPRPQLKEKEEEILLARLKDMFKITGEKLISKYDVYKPAIEAMVTAFEEIKSESTLLSAFHTFGKVGKPRTLPPEGEGWIEIPQVGYEVGEEGGFEDGGFVVREEGGEVLETGYVVESCEIEKGGYEIGGGESGFEYLADGVVYSMVVGENDELRVEENITMSMQ